MLKILLREPRLQGYGIMSAISNRSGEALRAKDCSLY
jgi:hypothetical protein